MTKKNPKKIYTNIFRIVIEIKGKKIVSHEYETFGDRREAVDGLIRTGKVGTSEPYYLCKEGYLTTVEVVLCDPYNAEVCRNIDLADEAQQWIDESDARAALDERHERSFRQTI